MIESDAVKLKARLDADIANDATNSGVLFGEVAYFTFLHKGWIVWRRRVGILPPHIEFEETSYAGRSAICDPRLGDEEARIG